MKAWRVLESRPLLDRPWAKIRVERVQTAHGVVLEDYPVIETPDWVCIVCLTRGGELVLVNQYRHGVGRTTVEFPAGGIEAGEEPLAAAKRELAEETGYSASVWHHLASIQPETTRHSHTAHLFLAELAKLDGPPSPDPAEDISVSLCSLAQAGVLRSKICHGIHQLALMLAVSKLEER